MNFDDKFRNCETVKINVCYQLERRFEKKAELLWQENIFLGLSHYHNSKILKPETLGTLVTLIEWF